MVISKIESYTNFTHVSGVRGILSFTATVEGSIYELTAIPLQQNWYKFTLMVRNTGLNKTVGTIRSDKLPITEKEAISIINVILEIYHAAQRSGFNLNT